MSLEAFALWTTVFVTFTWMLLYEPDAFEWLILQCQGLWQFAYGLWFRIWEHPDSPIRRWLIARNASRMAKELIKEFENRE